MLRGLAGLLVLGLVFFAANFVVQVYRKPTELAHFTRPSDAKTPERTWREFGPDFRRYSTGVMTPDFLAALAQVESSGDPLASPDWTWRWSINPWKLYGPPSTAVGLLQMTDGNFSLIRALCAKAGGSAASYSRMDPAQSIEMTSAFLHFNVHKMLGSRRVALTNKQKLAAVIHLCGPDKGLPFVRCNFNADAMGSCGGQPVGPYVSRVMKYRAQFGRLALAESGAHSRG